jgi:4-hydroxy-tetrahydrodipicolinate synthase
MTAQLRGVLTALATPFAADGSVDEARLRALVDRSIDGGVHGVVACGSTGEFSALSGDERRLVVETVVDQAARRVPVIAQTGATSTAEAIRLSRHAQSAGVDVVMPVAPYYEALSVEETLTYLRAVAGSVDIPVMLYNLPMATGVDLHPDTVGALAREVENIRYIKNTTMDMAQSAQLIHNHGDVISTFVGWDSLLLSALAEGATGVMGGTANVVPAELVAVYDAVSAGDLEKARRAWAQIYPLIDAMISQPFIAAVKAGLAAVSFPIGVPAHRSPSSTPTRPPASRSSRPQWATRSSHPEFSWTNANEVNGGTSRLTRFNSRYRHLRRQPLRSVGALSA